MESKTSKETIHDAFDIGAIAALNAIHSSFEIFDDESRLTIKSIKRILKKNVQYIKSRK